MNFMAFRWSKLGLLIYIAGWFGLVLMTLMQDKAMTGYMITFAAITAGGGIFLVAGANNEK